MPWPFRSLMREMAADRSDDSSPEAVPPEPARPVLWLLGKTGAGKSSLVRALTGFSGAEVGNGFAPCTRNSMVFDYPPGQPVMRFLDTRGLGEPGYDPDADLRECEGRSHAILAMARLDDPVQGEVAEALRAVRRRAPRTRVIVAHTAADLVPDEQERFRALATNQKTLAAALGTQPPSVTLALGPNAQDGVDTLVDLLSETMPDVAHLLARESLHDAERAAFARSRPMVVWYASAAGAADVAPVVGAVTVPALQASMLRALGRRYGVEWTRARVAGLVGALGFGAAARFGANYGLRQAAKLIPIYGQTVGAAAAGTLSFAATFALGRAAAYYLHQTQIGATVAPEALRQMFRTSLREARREHR